MLINTECITPGSLGSSTVKNLNPNICDFYVQVLLNSDLCTTRIQAGTRTNTCASVSHMCVVWGIKKGPDL
jgi:hypothetical protein